jgi:hypothetical protein
MINYTILRRRRERQSEDFQLTEEIGGETFYERNYFEAHFERAVASQSLCGEHPGWLHAM